MDEAKNWIWVLKGEPKDVKIIDREGKERHPDLQAVKKHARLKPALVGGSRFSVGVGNLFYGGVLGRREELKAQGNEHTTNTEILRALGYEKGEQASPPAAKS